MSSDCTSSKYVACIWKQRRFSGDRWVFHIFTVIPPIGGPAHRMLSMIFVLPHTKVTKYDHLSQLRFGHLMCARNRASCTALTHVCPVFMWKTTPTIIKATKRPMINPCLCTARRTLAPDRLDPSSKLHSSSPNLRRASSIHRFVVQKQANESDMCICRTATEHACPKRFQALSQLSKTTNFMGVWHRDLLVTFVEMRKNCVYWFFR